MMKIPDKLKSFKVIAKAGAILGLAALASIMQISVAKAFLGMPPEGYERVYPDFCHLPPMEDFVQFIIINTFAAIFMLAFKRGVIEFGEKRSGAYVAAVVGCGLVLEVLLYIVKPALTNGLYATQEPISYYLALSSPYVLLFLLDYFFYVRHKSFAATHFSDKACLVMITLIVSSFFAIMLFFDMQFASWKPCFYYVEKDNLESKRSE